LQAGSFTPHTYVADYAQRPHGTTDATWRLFM
jgi:hypothetical protein